MIYENIHRIFTKERNLERLIKRIFCLYLKFNENFIFKDFNFLKMKIYLKYFFE